MMRGRRWTAALAVAGMLSLTGCSAITGFLGGGDTAVRDGQSSEITEGGTLDVFTLKVGDCYDDTDADTVTDIPVVPCSTAHDLEVYYEYSLTDVDFPGEDAITTSADETCTTQFTAFVGMDYNDSTLDFAELYPTQESWEGQGDRVIQCPVGDPAGQVTGTLASAKR